MSWLYYNFNQIKWFKHWLTLREKLVYYASMKYFNQLPAKLMEEQLYSTFLVLALREKLLLHDLFYKSSEFDAPHIRIYILISFLSLYWPTFIYLDAVFCIHGIMWAYCFLYSCLVLWWSEFGFVNWLINWFIDEKNYLIIFS